MLRNILGYISDISKAGRPRRKGKNKGFKKKL